MSENENPSAISTLPPSLEEVRQRFESWRQRRKKRSRIPENLWRAAAALSEEYSINHLAKVLRVNYTALKNQVIKFNSPETNAAYVSSSTFVELPGPMASVVPESTVEMIKPDGAVMRMQIKGTDSCDLLELAKAFWATAP